MPVRARRSAALRVLVLAAALLTAVSALSAGSVRPAAADPTPGCRVTYTSSDFGSIFIVSITIANDGPATNGWRIDFTFPSPGQHLGSPFNAKWTQNGQAVSAVSNTWNARIATGSSTTIGFYGNVTGPDPTPTDIRILGCGDQPFPPTSMFTNPTDGRVMYEGQVTVLSTDTLGFPGSVNRIDYRANGVLLGSSTTMPFSLQWYPLPLGTFTLTATAYDDRGASATSAPVQFIVRPMPPPPAG